jgi:hypothetical protein
MRESKYPLPDCLRGKCAPAKYSRWLARKAQAHVRRDRKRNGKGSCTAARYKAEIHRAVLAGGDRDFYTGELLDWSIIGKFENDAAKAGRSPYKRAFWLLPTVDHTFDERGKQKFVICSWKVNDAKSDLTLKEFHELCESVLRYRDATTTSANFGKLL